MIIHFNGRGGVGKLTVAEILATRFDAKIIDNHMVINFVTKFWERRTPEYYAMFRKVMDVVLGELVVQSKDGFVIFTNWLSADVPEDRERLEQIKQFAADRGEPFVQILLDCNLIENKKRIVSEDRHGKGKLMNADLLEQIFNNNPYHPEAKHSMRIDSTDRSAEAVADEITNYLAGINR